MQDDKLLPERMRGGLHVCQAGHATLVVGIHQNGDCRRLGHQLMQQFYLLSPQPVTDKSHFGYVAARLVEAGNEAFSDGIVAGREYNWHGRSHRLRCRCRSDVADDHSDLPADQLGYQPRQLIIATLGRAKFDRDVVSLDARNRNDSGIVRSMAVAALRLMIRVNRVGTSTGRSAGLPLSGSCPPRSRTADKHRAGSVRGTSGRRRRRTLESRRWLATGRGPPAPQFSPGAY